MKKVTSKAQYKRVIRLYKEGAITKEQFDSYTDGVQFVTLPEKASIGKIINVNEIKELR